MTLTMLRAPALDAATNASPRALAVWRAQPGALLLLGCSTTPPPKGGSARMAGAAGVFRAESWHLPSDAGYGFLAAIRLPHAADRADGVELTLRGGRGADRDFRLIVSNASASVDFGRSVAGMVGAEAARIARFMLDVMQPDGSDTRQPGAVIDAFLSHAARPDGCVELVMHVPQHCTVLQGWGIPTLEPVELIVPTGSQMRFPAEAGQFQRPDIVAPATGIVLALPPNTAGAIAGLERLFMLSGKDLLCRHVVDARMLDMNASIGQIRHLLPRLDCPPPLQALLRSTLQPQFEGHDTLNAAGRPVRAAIDLAVFDTNGGAYLSGWIFDPAGLVAELHLCTGDIAIRLDDVWDNIKREDVSLVFQVDPAFPAPPGHDWGFAVSIPVAPPKGKSAYLRVTFTDNDLAFVPIRQTQPPFIPKLLASVDLHKASGTAVIERQLAPFISRLSSPQLASGQFLLRGPLDRPRAIVVSLSSPALPRSFLSNFLLEPATEAEQIIFVCGPEWDHRRCEAMIDLIRFYDLPASVIRLNYAPLPANVILEATAATSAQSFLLVSSGLVGGAPGWRETLHQAAPEMAVACPTVLFEDRSLRFAGSKQLTFLDRSPFVHTDAPLAGACASLASEGEPQPTEGGTFACCLIHRSATRLLSGVTALQTEAGQETGFFLALREAGMSAAWVRSVCVSAPEDDALHVVPAAPLVDGWLLRHTWKEVSKCGS